MQGQQLDSAQKELKNAKHDVNYLEVEIKKRRLDIQGDIKKKD